MSSAFDSADFYAPAGYPHETISEKSPKEVVVNYNLHEPPVRSVVIQGFKRVVVSDDWIDRAAERLFEDVAESFSDEFGDPDGSNDGLDDNAEKAVFPLFVVAVRKMIREHAVVFRCEPVGEREYSPEQILEMVGGK